jgi:hypothetical protein
MKHIPRLLLVGGLIIAESLLAQTDSTAAGSGHRHRGPGGPGRLPPVLRALDVDRDGEISPAEIAGSSAALSTLDADADGSVSTAEMHPPRPERPADAPPPPADAGRRGPRGPGGPEGRGGRPHPVFPVMLALDANADGALSATEIENSPASLKALDANGDGKLTHDELRPLPPQE